MRQVLTNIYHGDDTRDVMKAVCSAAVLHDLVIRAVAETGGVHVLLVGPRSGPTPSFCCVN